jgi:hypothetical protein
VTRTPLRVLVLYRSKTPLASATARHVRALERSGSRHEVTYYNAVHRTPEWLRFLRFDAVVLHATWLGMCSSPTFPLWKWSARWLADVERPKLALPQEEFDGAEVLDEWLYELGVTDVFSVFDEGRRAVLYPLMRDRARFHRCLACYVDEETAARLAGRQTPARDRPLGLVYRAKRLPFRFGSHGQLPRVLGEAVRARAEARGLACDISTRAEDTIRTGWFEFLMSGRATIGCESGSSALDRRGEIRAAIDALLAEDPELSFEAVRTRLPPGWDDHAFFTVDARHLEAAMTGTAQILVEGGYDGILEPERHYLSVRRDLSNLDEVLERATDAHLLEHLAESAHADLVASGRYGYRRFAEQLEAALPMRAAASSRLRRRVVDAAVKAESAFDTHKPAWVARFLVRPRSTAAKAGAALRHAIVSPTSRRLVVDYLRAADVRRAAGADRLLADLLRLGRLEGVAARLEEGGRVIRLHAGRNGGVAPGELVAALRSGRVTTILGVDGVYRFEALAALARHFPDDAAEALAAVLAGDAGRRPYPSDP